MSGQDYPVGQRWVRIQQLTHAPTIGLSDPSATLDLERAISVALSDRHAVGELDEQPVGGGVRSVTDEDGAPLAQLLPSSLLGDAVALGKEVAGGLDQQAYGAGDVWQDDLHVCGLVAAYFDRVGRQPGVQMSGISPQARGLRVPGRWRHWRERHACSRRPERRRLARYTSLGRLGNRGLAGDPAGANRRSAEDWAGTIRSDNKNRQHEGN